MIKRGYVFLEEHGEENAERQSALDRDLHLVLLFFVSF